MSNSVISIHTVSKLYRIGQGRLRYKTLRDAIAEKVARGIRGGASLEKERSVLWALRDVSFEVQQGEVVGIIGRNGAGKSTLLKILARITYPTEGRITMTGRVGSLLEVGTGFHPELTGRENVYLNGAILGMGRREIRRKFDEIVDFSGIEAFLDTPVKRYSSGMAVRLAFSVAAHLEAEVLLVDEVLAVGDVEFQRKCLGKMNDVVRSGRTILFVSHNMAAVEGLCSRAVLLDHGRVACVGEVDEVLGQYLTRSVEHQGNIDLTALPAGSGGLLKRFRILDKSGRPCAAIPLGESVLFELEGESPTRINNVVMNIGMDTLMGQRVASFNTHFQYRAPVTLQGPFRMQCRFENCRLRPGPYLLSLTLKSADNLLQRITAIPVEIVATDIYGSGKIQPQNKGVYLPEAVWLVEGTQSPKTGLPSAT